MNTPQTTTRIPQASVEKSPAFNIENIFSLAIEKQGTAETLEKLMAIRRELNAEASKKAFDFALAAFQSECPVIVKSKAVMNKDGRSVRYHFAPLDSILKQVQPILEKHGFSYRFTTATNTNKVKVFCVAAHSNGHAETSEFESPIDPQAFMNEQQKFAAALTYAKRYAFCNAFGILTGDEDVDGETKREKPAGPSVVQPSDSTLKDLARELWNVLKPVRGDAQNWTLANQWLWKNEILDGGVPEEAPHLTADKFKAAISASKEILK